MENILKRAPFAVKGAKEKIYQGKLSKKKKILVKNMHRPKSSFIYNFSLL